MKTRTKILLGMLAGATILEAAACIYETAITTFVYSYPWHYLLREEPRARPIFYSMVGANVTFIALLTTSAVFLWMFRRKGLAILTWTLCVEAAYSIIIVIWGALSGLAFQSGPQGTAAAIWGAASVGNAALIVQLWTLYPLIAAGLVFLGYRSMRQREPMIGTNI